MLVSFSAWKPLLGLSLGLLLVAAPAASAQRRPAPLPSPGSTRPVPEPPKVQVAPAAFPTDFAKLTALAGGGPYDLILVAVRSRLPFEYKTGESGRQQEVVYAEALCPRNASPNLKLLFCGVPLRVENNGSHPANTYLRTQTSALAPAAALTGPDGPLWQTLGAPGEAVAKYRSDAPGGAVYPYPHRYDFEAPTVGQKLFYDERLRVYEYKLDRALTLRAKQRPLPPGLQRTAAPQDAFFLLIAPKAKQQLTYAAPPAREEGNFQQSFTPEMVYGGPGTPQPAVDIFGAFRAYCWQSITVRHHEPGKPAQRWLLVTADEVAGLVSGH